MISGGTEIPNHPGLKLLKREVADPTIKSLQKPKEITPVQDIWADRINWTPGEIGGGTFEPNEQFKKPDELLTLLESVTTELVQPEQFDRPHVITISCDQIVGRTGVAEITPTENHSSITFHTAKGQERKVKVVFRKAKPETNLITYIARPVEQTGLPPKFQITNAFPGEPSLPVNDPYWNNHAFVADKDTLDYITRRIRFLSQEHNNDKTPESRREAIRLEVKDLRATADEVKKLQLISVDEDSSIREAVHEKDEYLLVALEPIIRKPLGYLGGLLSEREGPASVKNVLDLIAHPTFLSSAERLLAVQMINDALQAANPSRKITRDLNQIQTDYFQLLANLEKQEEQQYQAQAAEENIRLAQLELEYVEREKEMVLKRQELDVSTGKTREALDEMVRYAVQNGASTETFEHIDEVCDPRVYILNPNIDAPAIYRPYFPYNILVDPIYADNIHATLHESNHRAYYLSRRNNAYHTLAEMYGIPIKNRAIDSDDSRFQKLANGARDDEVARLHVLITTKEKTLIEGLHEWSTETSNRLRKKQGRELVYPEDFKTYEKQVAAVDQIKAHLIRQKGLSEEKADALIISTALSGDLTILTRITGKAFIKNILDQTPEVPAFKQF